MLFKNGGGGGGRGGGSSEPPLDSPLEIKGKMTRPRLVIPSKLLALKYRWVFIEVFYTGSKADEQPK